MREGRARAPVTLSAADAEAFSRCLAAGGVAVFPSDTVYGLACEPGTKKAVRRIYALKGRSGGKPSALMFFSLALALAALPELGSRTAAALERLLPGALTLLVPNPGRRFPLACGPDQTTLGVRVPALPAAAAALTAVRRPVLQTSANHAAGPDARRVADVPAEIRRGADLVLDVGELPGVSSTVVDLRGYEEEGAWSVVREGAVPGARVTEALEAP